MIRRRLKWYGQLLQTDTDVPSKDVLMNKKEWFTPWFFGTKWEEAVSLSEDEEAWGEFVEKCVKEQACQKKDEKKPEIET